MRRTLFPMIISIATTMGIVISPVIVCDGAAKADEVHLLSALVMKPALGELSGEFERVTGHKLMITYDSAGAVKKRVQAGEAVDAAIIQKPALETLLKEGKIGPNSIVVLARSGHLVGVQNAL